jgi:hypothetical protein
LYTWFKEPHVLAAVVDALAALTPNGKNITNARAKDFASDRPNAKASKAAPTDRAAGLTAALASFDAVVLEDGAVEHVSTSAF